MSQQPPFQNPEYRHPQVPPTAPDGPDEKPKPLGALIVGLSLALIVASFLVGIAPLLWVGLAVAAVGVVTHSITNGSGSSSKYTAPVQPIAHSPDGQPVYPIVGYTPDGQPITADRAVGYTPHNPRTNTLAIVTLIISFAVSPLAVPLGLVALSQIKQTGEQGRGLAVAGLVIGCIGVIAFIVMAAIVAANF